MQPNATQTTNITLGTILLQAKSGFVAVAVFSLFLNLLMLTAPLYTLQVFDRVLSSHSFDTLFWLTLLAITAFVILSLLDVVRNRILGTIGTWLDSSLGALLVRSGLNKAAILADPTPPSSSLRDLAQIRNFLSGNGTLALIDVPWTPFFIVIVYLLHPWLGMMAIGGITILILLTVLGEMSARKRLQKSNSELSTLYNRIDSAAQSADALVSMGALDRIIDMWKRTNQTLLDHTQQVNGRLASAVASGKFVRLTLQILIMGLGAMLVINEELTPGGMIASSIILARALAPIEQLIGAWRAFVGCREAMQRVSKQLELLHQEQGRIIIPYVSGRVEVSNIAFAIPEENRFLFRDISFSLDTGEVLGIVGPSGSGKSTLARMLVGLLAPTTGHVHVDGSDIAHWAHQDMGHHIGYLPQRFGLFEGTIRENISRFNDYLPIEMVIEAATEAGVHDFINRLPKGYETVISRNSKFISGGQQQRIALARALFGTPSIIVMDEPNANLDPAGENALLKATQNLREKGITTILVSHRSNILQSATKILMIKGGRGELITPRTKPATANKVLGPSYRYVDEAMKKRRTPQTPPSANEKIERLKQRQLKQQAAAARKNNPS